MAKSLRSKWRRKCKAIKRERYDVKELARLKKTLGITDDATEKDKIMEDISLITVETNASTIKKDKVIKTTMNIINEDGADSEMEETIEVKKDGDTESRIYNTKTMKDQYGQYPVWMHQRKIKANKNANGKNKDKKKKRNLHKITKNKGRKGKFA